MYRISVINNTEWNLLENITTNIYCFFLNLFCDKNNSSTTTDIRGGMTRL